MAEESDTRHHQGRIFRKVALSSVWTFRRLSVATGISYPALRKFASGHRVLDCYTIARIAHVRDLSDRAVRDLVDATAIRWHYAHPGTVHPFDRPCSDE